MSDAGVHPLIAEREYARLMRNMSIEYGLLLLSKLDKSKLWQALETYRGSHFGLAGTVVTERRASESERVAASTAGGTFL
jgi:hypothetical protein